MTEVAITPVAFVRAIVAAYRRYGKDPGDALRRARIAPEFLSDPRNRVTGSQMQTLFGIAIQELDDEALGWFSRRLPWGSYGMLCRATLGSPTLEVALKRWCRYHGLLTDDIALKFTVTRSAAAIVIQINRDLGEMEEFCFATLFRYILGYACWAVNSRIPLLETCFPFDALEHVEVYRMLFPGPLHFRSESAKISFDPQYAALSIRRDDRALNKMLQHAVPLTIFPYRRDRLLVQRVRELLRMQPDSPHTGESLAMELHVSPRTLHRQLQEEGTSLQALKNEIRRDRAVELLNRTSRPIKQIAPAVGFHNEKSFSRAFKQWTGVTPESVREKGRHFVS
ncbi:MAG: AraC family transcriptional regulator [Candidatus Competibacter phosphatis]|uniref:AraC family transcriptional regulator n=1 Tax=Candidatus Competibacter phosphatis TaxID=221280 RepID=A0ABX1TFF3_9GAMM|nr:AraC family transcriptional regulator [Candidatus Competibacter phosphatis]NMQ18100.1 AraC family transcriptional regulator [Candidatus Competibacter phosphatis]